MLLIDFTKKSKVRSVICIVIRATLQNKQTLNNTTTPDQQSGVAIFYFFGQMQHENNGGKLWKFLRKNQKEPFYMNHMEKMEMQWIYNIDIDWRKQFMKLNGLNMYQIPVKDVPDDAKKYIVARIENNWL